MSTNIDHPYSVAGQSRDRPTPFSPSRHSLHADFPSFRHVEEFITTSSHHSQLHKVKSTQSAAPVPLRSPINLGSHSKNRESESRRQDSVKHREHREKTPEPVSSPRGLKNKQRELRTKDDGCMFCAIHAQASLTLVTVHSTPQKHVPSLPSQIQDTAKSSSIGSTRRKGGSSSSAGTHLSLGVDWDDAANEETDDSEDLLMSPGFVPWNEPWSDYDLQYLEQHNIG